MNDSEVGRRVREQVSRFSGIFSPRFSKPEAHFVEQMIFGIQAAQDVKLPGHWSCVAMACEPDRRRIVPLPLRLWSAEAPDFVSENHQLLEVIDTVRAATDGRGIYVIDRGGDRIKLFNPFLDRKMRFIARLIGNRDLVFRGQRREAAGLARGCSMRYAETLVHEEGGKEHVYHLEYGFRKVRLPDREEPLVLVVVRGFGEEPLMLLTNVEVKASRKSLWFIVKGYLARWMVEETIRFIKQSYHLEDIRVLDYDRLKNLVALTLAAAYFAAVWLGEKLRLAVLCRRVAKLAKRFFGVPEFHYYALADGIRTLLSRLGRWIPPQDNLVDTPDAQQMLFIE